jgi:hypothetical protein
LSDQDEFYKFVGDIYKPDIKRHSSPTMRLIAQKNSAWEHKEVFK